MKKSLYNFEKGILLQVEILSRTSNGKATMSMLENKGFTVVKSIKDNYLFKKK